MSTPASPPAPKKAKRSIGQRMTKLNLVRSSLVKAAVNIMTDVEYDKLENATIKKLINNIDDAFDECQKAYQDYKANVTDANLVIYSAKYDDMTNAQISAADTFRTTIEPLLKQSGDFQQIATIERYLHAFDTAFWAEGLLPAADVELVAKQNAAPAPINQSALQSGLVLAGVVSAGTSTGTGTSGAAASAGSAAAGGGGGQGGPPGGPLQPLQQQQSATVSQNQYTLYTSPNINLIDKEVGKFNGEKAVLKPQQYLMRFESAVKRQVQSGQITSVSTIALFKMLLTDTARSWHELVEMRALHGDVTSKTALEDWAVYKQQFLDQFALKVSAFEADKIKTKLASEVRNLSGDQELIFMACERASYSIHSEKQNDNASVEARRATTVELFLKYCDAAIKTQLARITLGSSIITYENIRTAIEIVKAYREMSKMSISRGGVSAVTAQTECTDALDGDEAAEVSAVHNQTKKKKKKKNAEGAAANRDDAVAKGLCFFCKSSGHVKAYCPTFKANKPEEYKKFRNKHDQIWAERKKQRAQAQASAVAEDGATSTTTTATNNATMWSAERGQAAAVTVPPNQYSDVHALLALHQQE